MTGERPSDRDETALYRRVIDEMVRACKEGQGQIGARRATGGVWNVNAESRLAGDHALDEFWAQQLAANALLAKLAAGDRDVLATMLAGEFVSGMHEALVILHEAGLRPFDKSYEGTPFHDFIGRLDGWAWPDRERWD